MLIDRNNSQLSVGPKHKVNIQHIDFLNYPYLSFTKRKVMCSFENAKEKKKHYIFPILIYTNIANPQLF